MLNYWGKTKLSKKGFIPAGADFGLGKVHKAWIWPVVV
jgi:hypothetical protein